MPLIADWLGQHLRVLPILFLLLLSCSVSAAPSSPSTHDAWLSLNYYKPDGQAFTSEITNDDYFLSSNGRRSPSEEYKAFTSAMDLYRDRGEGADTLCAFPARLTYVMTHDPAYAQFVRPVCRDFIAQSDPTRVTSVSLVFASGYFDSPASYFGHTMLKFDTDKERVSHYLFESSLNYGAKITDSTSNPMYVINGLTGGYVASYNRDNELINTHSYTNNQMRDVWTYTLNLTPAQKTFLLEHAWELRRARFSYYFLNDNCAHRIARLIDMATQSNLSRPLRPWLLPINVIQAASTVSPTFIQDEVRHPALTTTLRTRYVALTSSEQKDFVRYFTAEDTARTAMLSSFTHATLSVILMEYDIRLAALASKPRDDEAIYDLERRRQHVLAELFRQPAPIAQVSSSHSPNHSSKSPASAQRASMLQLGFIVRPGDDAIRLRYQAANNDLLTPRTEGQESSRFIMGALETEATKRQFDIRRATFLDIVSLNTSPIPFQVNKDYSWGFRAAYAPRNDICHKCSAISLDATLGFANRVSDDLLLYALAGPQLNHRTTSLNDYLMVTAEQGALLDLTSSSRVHASLSQDISPLHGDPHLLVQSTFGLDVTPQHQLRLSAQYDGDDTMVGVFLGLHFN